jgi:tRNA G10  N-methylase Trm11
MFDKRAPLKRSPLPAFLKSLNETIEAVSSIDGVLSNQVETRVEHGNSEKLKLADSSIDAVVTHPPYIGSVPYAEYGALSLMWLGSDPKALDAVLTGGKRQSKDVVRNFENSYRRIIGECHRVLRHGHYAFFMVGNPTVKGELVDLREMTLKLAKEHSFKFIGETLRHGSNRRANKMDVEFLLFFQK